MKWLGVATSALFVIGLTGCGGDDGNGPEETAAPKAAAGAQTLKVSETEFKLDPSDPKVKKGIVNFEVTNDGKVTHSLEVEGPSGELELEKALQPGRSGTLRVNMSKAGRYEWYCPIDGHKDSGMRGEITVGAKSAGGGGTPKSGNDSGAESSY